MFLTQSVPTELRRVHERDLIRCWRDRVVALCPEAAVYPYERAWEHYRRLTLFAPTYAVVVGGSMDSSDEGNRVVVTAPRRRDHCGTCVSRRANRSCRRGERRPAWDHLRTHGSARRHPRSHRRRRRSDPHQRAGGATYGPTVGVLHRPGPAARPA